MSTPDNPPEDESTAPEPEWERRRRLAAVFGDGTPEQTSDDTDRGWGERPGGNDDWLLAERPPHWG